MAKSAFLTIVKERGFFHQCTDENALDTLLTDAESNNEAISAYIGFDCTAPSLHVGSLVPIMMLYWWQQCGHKPIVLMGGGTTKVGDPSGKDESRRMLNDDVIEQNMQGIKKHFSAFLTFGDTTSDAIMLNNDAWLSKLDMYEYLRDVGKHFTVNRMLTMESVKQRLERDAPFSFIEFNYMILQSYDFHWLSQQHDCRLQMGGSDQWGNIVNGTDLHRRMSDKNHPLYGLTTPLLTTASGNKMGKTAEGAVWLDADMCSPYDYWQYWRNCEDGDVIRFLKLFTTLPLEQINEYETWLGSAQINEAKKILATEATAMLHGRETAQIAARTAQKTFEQGSVGDALPEYYVEQSVLDAGIPAFKLFLEVGLASSGGEARRTIKGGGARVNDTKITEETQIISRSDLTEEGYIKLSSGKKKHALAKIKPA